MIYEVTVETVKKYRVEAQSPEEAKEMMASLDDCSPTVMQVGVRQAVDVSEDLVALAGLGIDGPGSESAGNQEEQAVGSKGSV